MNEKITKSRAYTCPKPYTLNPTTLNQFRTFFGQERLSFQHLVNLKFPGDKAGNAHSLSFQSNSVGIYDFRARVWYL